MAYIFEIWRFSPPLIGQAVFLRESISPNLEKLESSDAIKENDSEGDGKLGFPAKKLVCDFCVAQDADLEIRFPS